MVSDTGCGGGEVAEAFATLQQERPGWTYALYLQSVPDTEWDAMAMEFERPAAGSPAFLALVEEKRRSPLIYTPINADSAAISPIERSSAKSSQNLRNPVRSLAMTMSLAMASVALVAAFLSTRNVDFLRHTVKVLAEENSHTLLALSATRASASPVQLAAFRLPERLGGTSWQIQLKPMVGSDASALTDRLRFEGDKVVSERLGAAGFPVGRFHATPTGQGTASWEAASIGPGGETVQWRGEWDGRAMHGVMTRQMPGGAVTTFRFIGIAQDGDTA